jgi:hypothetical protein
MCDYSLHAVASRPALVGDQLVSTRFCNTQTRGFAAPQEPNVAVCLLPGTEIAFQIDVESERPSVSCVTANSGRRSRVFARSISVVRPIITTRWSFLMVRSF